MLAAPRGDAFRLRGLLVGLTDAAAREREERILQRPRLHGKVVCGHADLAKCQDDRVREVPLTGHDHQAPVVFQAAHLGQGGPQRLVEGGRGRKRTTLPPAAGSARRAGVSVATMRPASTSATWSHRCWASSMSWVTSRVATPRSRTAFTRSQVSRRACGSSPVVSSSSTAIVGRPIKESAMESRCFCPPDRSLKNVSRLSDRPRGLHEVLRIVRVPVEGGVQQQGLSCSQLGWLGALLQLHTHPLAQRGVVRERIEAEHPDRPSVRHAEPDDALHGRGLACAVRAKQAEDLALGHAETDVLDRYSRPITPVQVRNLDDRHAGSPNALGQTRPGSSVRLKTGNRKRWQAG